ncbi:MAG TPA: hypothetical protein VKB39_02985 [Candidatus Baltobacteraceae bacterium]|nr:hypothetical protein [Candidatus Baltobacteraceae bacterium]
MRPLLAFAVLLFTSSATIPALADAPPMRHLVYSFTYGSQQNVRARDASAYATDGSGNIAPVASSGSSNYQGALGDKGTMVVDVMREQPDKGLVVVISENAEVTRRAPPATCVVYANTEVICDPNKTVNPEEYTLLRFMAQNFVDPNILDAKKHWGYDTSDGGMALKADYTIVHSDGQMMTIDEVRSLKRAGTQGQTTNVQSTINYDFGHAVPTAIAEYVTQRSDGGVGGSATTIYQTNLKLVSDSLAKGT